VTLIRRATQSGRGIPPRLPQPGNSFSVTVRRNRHFLPAVTRGPIASLQHEEITTHTNGGIPPCGAAFGLHGPADLTFAEATRILGESLGRPLRYEQIPPNRAYQSVLDMGASPGFATAYVEMYQALAAPDVVAEPRTPETTTPTTLRAWSDEVLRPLLA
jgi:hypothetical protein